MAVAFVAATSGCVSITSPPAGFTTPSNTVQAEVRFRSQVRPNSFEVTLDGTDVTASFNPQPPAATPPQATFSNLAVGQHTLRASAEVLVYWFLFPYWDRQSASTQFTVTTPVLNFAPTGPLNLLVGGTGTRTVTASVAPAAALTISLASSSAAAAVPASTTIGAGATSSVPITVTAQSPGSATITASAPGFQSATLPVSVPTPDFSVDVTTADQSVAWGNNPSYMVAIRSLNGFSQPVSLSAIDLPDGSTASFSPATVTPPVGGSAASTMTISTAVAVTEVGTTQFRVVGTGPGNVSRRDEARLTVQRVAGAFGPNIYPLQSGNDTCPRAAPVVTATVVAGPSVQFTSPLGTTNPSPDFGPGYDIASNCRTGFVIPPPVGVPPNQQWFVNLVNLLFEPTTGAPGINNSYDFASVVNEARFSPDASIVAIIGPGPGGAAGGFSIQLRDVVTHNNSSSVPFDGIITSLNLTGEEVLVIGNDAGVPFDFTMQLP